MEKSKILMIVIIALLVILLGTTVAVSIYVMRMVASQPDLTEAELPVAQVSQNIPLKDTASISLGDAIVTNLAKGTDGTSHFIRVSGYVTYDMTQEEASTAIAETLTANVHVARSIALACIRGYSFEELSDPEGLTNLSDKIMHRLQEEFESTLIITVYLEDYLLQ